MDLTSGLLLGRIRGIEIRIHWSWLLIAGLLSWTLAGSVFDQPSTGWSPAQRWAAAWSTTVLFFGSVLVHELAHAFVAQSYGMRVPSITLFVFGGVSNLAGEMRTAGQEFRIAIAGPLTSWVLGGLFGALWLATRHVGVSTVFGYLAVVNATLGVFNLLPGFPLDGGRVFRAIAWSRSHDQLGATRLASRVGSGLAWLLIGGGVIAVFAYGLLGGLWYVLIGLFLKSASEGAYRALVVDRALERFTVAQVMRAAPEPVSGTDTIRQLIDERILRTGDRAIPVVEDGRVVGLITTTDVARVPREHWFTARVAEAMVPTERIATARPAALLTEALHLMQERDVNQLPVVDDGRLIGMLTRGDVLRQLEVRMRFEDPTP